MQTHASPKNINSNVSNSSKGLSNPSPIMQGQIPSQLEKQNNLNELASNSSKGKKLSSLQESANKKTERNTLKTPNLNSTTQVIQCAGEFDDLVFGFGSAAHSSEEEGSTFQKVKEKATNLFNAGDAFGAFDDIKNRKESATNFVQSEAEGQIHGFMSGSKAFANTGFAGGYHKMNDGAAGPQGVEIQKEHEKHKSTAARKANPLEWAAAQAIGAASGVVSESASAAATALSGGMPGVGTLTEKAVSGLMSRGANHFKEKSEVGSFSYSPFYNEEDMANSNEFVGKESFLDGLKRSLGIGKKKK